MKGTIVRNERIKTIFGFLIWCIDDISDQWRTNGGRGDKPSHPRNFWILIYYEKTKISSTCKPLTPPKVLSTPLSLTYQFYITLPPRVAFIQSINQLCIIC